jgi:hypothetical protein
MVEKKFAGQLMYKWFEQNQDILQARGFDIKSLEQYPNGDWKNPPVQIYFETENCAGHFEQRENGWCTFAFWEKKIYFPLFWTRKQVLEDLNDRKEKTFSFDILDPAVREYRESFIESERLRRLTQSSGNFRGFTPVSLEEIIKSFTLEVQHVVNDISDYDKIFEPLISKVLQYQSKPKKGKWQFLTHLFRK